MQSFLAIGTLPNGCFPDSAGCVFGAAVVSETGSFIDGPVAVDPGTLRPGVATVFATTNGRGVCG